MFGCKNIYFVGTLMVFYIFVVIFVPLQVVLASDYSAVINQALDAVEAQKGNYVGVDNNYSPSKNNNEIVGRDKDSGISQINSVPLQKSNESVQLSAENNNVFHDGRINSLDADNRDIRELLHEIAAKAGFNIVIADDVSGKETLHLNKIDGLEALRIAVGLSGLAFFKKDNTVYVITTDDFKAKYGYPFDKDIKIKTVKIKYADADNIIKRIEREKGKNGRLIYCADTKRIIIEDTPDRVNHILAIVRHMDVPVETEAFILQYVSPATIINKIRSALTSDVGKAYIDKSTNSIIVTDTVLGMKKIEKLIKSLDKQDKKIHVVGKIVQVVLDEEYSGGIDWAAIVSDYKSMSFLGFGDTDKKGDKCKLSFGTVNAEDFVVLLDALDTVGIIRNIAQRDIWLSEGKSADIRIKNDELSLISQKGNRSEREAKIKGVDFCLSPTVSDKDMVIMEITPKVIFANGEKVIGVDNRERHKSVMVTVANGATVVIGGLIKKEMYESMRKIPLLGDIPLLGRAFRSQARRLKNTEVIVFLTTSVVIKDKNKDRSL